MQYLDSQNESVSSFERRVGISNGYFANTKKRGSDVSQKVLDKIRDKIPDEYRKIFLDGVSFNESNQLEEPDNTSTGVNEPQQPYWKTLQQQKNSDEPYLVPFVDIPAQAGYTKAYQQRDYIATLKKYPILPDVDPTAATWRYFQVDGDSMEPELQRGDVLLCSQVPDMDWDNFRQMHTYVVVTDTQLLIKDVYRANEEYWALLSQNEHYEPIFIRNSDVRQLWVMRRHVKARAFKHRKYDIDAINKALQEKLNASK